MGMLSRLTRRQAMKIAAFGAAAGYSSSGWIERLAGQAGNNPQRRRSCILLWMNGGPSQMDTFDLKPGHANGGPYQEIQTNAPGVRISEHLPRLAQHADKLAIIRSMTSREGDHGRATFLMHTGYLPQGPVSYPTLGSLVSKELGQDDAPLPNCVSIAPFRQFNPAAFSSGFLGPVHAPLLVAENGANFAFNPNPNDGPDVASLLRVEDMRPSTGISTDQFNSRVDLLEEMEREFSSSHPTTGARSHQSAYARAVRLMRTSARSAFNIEEEPARIRDAYGRNLFGQGCLLARRLVERGVPFVEVNLVANGNPVPWDTHGQNFQQVRQLSQILDPAWATLMADLEDRGLLDSTLIVWMGEFGRTPRINGGQGRDHYSNAWTTVLGGGGIRGGQAFGATSADGTTVEGHRPVTVPDFMATVFRGLGLDQTTMNMSNAGRPIPLADHGSRPVTEILA